MSSSLYREHSTAQSALHETVKHLRTCRSERDDNTYVHVASWLFSAVRSSWHLQVVSLHLESWTSVRFTLFYIFLFFFFFSGNLASDPSPVPEYVCRRTQASMRSLACPTEYTLEAVIISTLDSHAIDRVHSIGECGLGLAHACLHPAQTPRPERAVTDRLRPRYLRLPNFSRSRLC